MSTVKEKALRKIYRELKKAGEHVEASKILELLRDGKLKDILKD